MEQQEKLAMRARLVASGILRYHQFNLLSLEELNQSVEILAEELANLNARDVAHKIRADVERYSLRVPEVNTDIQADPQVGLETSGRIDDVNGSQVEELKPVPFRYVRRANNQVSEQLEACIRDLLGCGWKKSAVARVLRVNRRVVIRVAREVQSAQSNNNRVSNDLGKSGS